MNLEYFPVNETAKRMMSTVTGNGFYDNSYTAKWLYQVMGTEMEDARELYEELRDQLFAETATWGLTYHEQKYGIPVTAGQTLEERRKRVIQKRDMRAPMNPRRLEVFISDYSGRPCEVRDPQNSYVFDILVDFLETTPVSVLEGIYARIDRLRPSHLRYNFYALMELISFYNQNTANLLSLEIAAFVTAQMGFSFEEVLIQIVNRTKNETAQEFKESFFLPVNHQFLAPDRLVFFMTQPNVENKVAVINEFRANATHSYSQSATITYDTMYTFDGTVTFDGSRRFNADTIKEDL